MARVFHRKERLSAMSEINVTPLIDLAFALLIIFMITAPLLEQSIDIALPLETPRDQASDRPRIQEVAITADGAYYWGDQAISKEELQERLELFAVENEPPVISIRADAGLPYQSVIDLMDLIKEQKLSRISLETRAR